MPADELTVAVIGVGAKDCMVMRSLFNLARGRGDGPLWRLEESGHGDLVVIDVDSKAGRAAWNERETGGRVIALTADKRFEASARLLKPLRSRDFFAVLERLAGLSEPPADDMLAPEVVKAESAGLAATRSSSEKVCSLADHLRLQTWQGPIALTRGEWPVLLIDPGSGAWFYDGEMSDLDPVQFSLPIPESAGVLLSNAELVERAMGHRQRLLSELKWLAGLAQTPGKLHPDLRGDVQFMLVQVPAEAMQDERLQQLAQIVLRGPITFSDLMVESGHPEATVQAFLNACYASGKLLLNKDWHAAGF